MKRVAIIGGGVTGLSAAHALEEAKRSGSDVDYVLLEKADRLGGVIKTDKIGGFTIDGGPDCFISHKQAVIDMADKLDFSDHLMGTNDAAKRTYVLSGGKLHKLPDGMLIMIPSKILPFAMSPLISWPGKARMLMDLFIPKKKDDREETVAEFVIRRLGKEALDKIAEPLIAGVHGCDPYKMSINGQAMILRMEQEHGSLIRAMLASRKRPPGAPKDWKPGTVSYVGKAKVPQTFFMTFKDGMQELTDRIAATCDPEKLHTGVRVDRVERLPGGGYRLRLDGSEPIDASAVIVATLADSAEKLLEGIDAELTELLGTIPNAASATISLGYRKSDVEGKFDGFGMVIPTSEGRKIMACTYSSIKWNHRVPDDEHVLVRTFIGGAHNQHLVELGDEEMLDLVLAEMRDIYGITAEPVVSKIYRWPAAMPQYNLGHQSRVQKIMELASRYEGLYLAGGSYNGVGVPDCVKSGLESAKKALEYLTK